MRRKLAFSTYRSEKYCVCVKPYFSTDFCRFDGAWLPVSTAYVPSVEATLLYTYWPRCMRAEIDASQFLYVTFDVCPMIQVGSGLLYGTLSSCVMAPSLLISSYS